MEAISEKVPFKVNDSDQILFFENKPEEYIISTQIADLKKNNIEIGTHKNMLTITSSKDTRHLDRIISVNDRSIYEIHQLSYSFALPSNADVNMATANCCGEMLVICFPKKDHAFFPPTLKIDIS